MNSLFCFQFPQVLRCRVTLVGAIAVWWARHLHGRFVECLHCLGHGTTNGECPPNVVSELLLILDEHVVLFVPRAVEDRSFDIFAASFEPGSRGCSRAIVSTAASRSTTASRMSPAVSATSRCCSGRSRLLSCCISHLGLIFP